MHYLRYRTYPAIKAIKYAGYPTYLSKVCSYQIIRKCRKTALPSFVRAITQKHKNSFKKLGINRTISYDIACSRWKIDVRLYTCELRYLFWFYNFRDFLLFVCWQFVVGSGHELLMRLFTHTLLYYVKESFFFVIFQVLILSKAF